MPCCRRYTSYSPSLVCTSPHSPSPSFCSLTSLHSPCPSLSPSLTHTQVRSELTYKEQQEAEMNLLEKRRERERSKAEAIQEDITFKTKMGQFFSMHIPCCRELASSKQLPRDHWLVWPHHDFFHVYIHDGCVGRVG